MNKVDRARKRGLDVIAERRRKSSRGFWDRYLYWASNRHIQNHPDYQSCRCRCYGCRHHCGAHWSWLLRTIRFWRHPIANYQWNQARRVR